MNNDPFFIVGCVRSGTTLLRDVLRRHPNLAAPEETHFYRWAEPFGGAMYPRMVAENKVLQRHREMDGIAEPEFQKILAQSVSRADLYRRYMGLYLQRNKPEAKRWFDKSPQNVYGAAMIAMEFPDAKFIHIVRNPLDVVSSLRIGKIIKVENLVGACNYWNEAAEIIQVIKRAFPPRIYEVKYEDFTREPLPEIKKMLAFLDEEFDSARYQDVTTERKLHDYGALFSEEELSQVVRLCAQWGAHYGYFEAHEEVCKPASMAG